MARCVLITVLILAGCGWGTVFAVKGYPVKGFATWYNPRLTASGERYRMNDLTCAMRKRDFGKHYLVCNLSNHTCVVVRHNDFGPALWLFWRGRIIDLSRHAFSKIADVNKGVIPVKIGEVFSAPQE
jgi:rare lipoprotein A